MLARVYAAGGVAWSAWNASSLEEDDDAVLPLLHPHATASGSAGASILRRSTCGSKSDAHQHGDQKRKTRPSTQTVGPHSADRKYHRTLNSVRRLEGGGFVLDGMGKEGQRVVMAGFNVAQEPVCVVVAKEVTAAEWTSQLVGSLFPVPQSVQIHQALFLMCIVEVRKMIKTRNVPSYLVCLRVKVMLC